MLFPGDVATSQAGQRGTYVLDMTDPARPIRTATLTSPAMDSPHESLNLNAGRGLLAADMGSPATAPGIVDIYDVSQDCRYPVLRSSTPLGLLGHASGFSPDGRTFWVSSTSATTLVALDVSDPALPSIVWKSSTYRVHGMNVSRDGNRLYATNLDADGVTIFDISQVQNRVAQPEVKEISTLTWPEASIPQNAIPVTIKGRPYLVEVDEYSRSVQQYVPASPVGAARIIDVSDEHKPKVVSNIRLEVNQPLARKDDQQNDPGAQFGVQGYAGHYCSVPQRAEPGIVACSFILSGLRVFDIRDPLKPREIAYFNKPAPNALPLKSGAFAMSAPAFAPERKEVWYADGNSGFNNVKLTNGAWPTH